MPLISPFLVWIFCIYWKFKTNRYLHRMCPQQKMSSIGKFRRNFTTFEQTTQFISINFFYGFVHQGLLFGLLQAFSFKPETNFLLANICDYLYMDIYHGIVLPMFMEIPPTVSQNKQRRAADFFVQKPQFLEPRRPLVQIEEQLTTRGSALESLQTNKRKKKRVKASRPRSSLTDLHGERERSSRCNNNTSPTTNIARDQTKLPAVIQVLPHSAAEEQGSKSVEDLSRENESIGNGTTDSPKKNLFRKMQNRSEKSATKIAPKMKSQTIKVHIHGSMSQSCDQIENSNFSSIMSDPIVPIDIQTIISSSFVGFDRHTCRSVPTFLGVLVVMVIEVMESFECLIYIFIKSYVSFFVGIIVSLGGNRNWLEESKLLAESEVLPRSPLLLTNSCLSPKFCSSVDRQFTDSSECQSHNLLLRTINCYSHIITIADEVKPTESSGLVKYSLTFLRK